MSNVNQHNINTIISRINGFSTRTPRRVVVGYFLRASLVYCAAVGQRISFTACCVHILKNIYIYIHVYVFLDHVDEGRLP